jgi:hypothetical protein
MMGTIFQAVSIDALIFAAAGFGAFGGFYASQYLNRVQRRRLRELLRYVEHLERRARQPMSGLDVVPFRQRYK